MSENAVIEVRNLTMKYGHRIIQQDLNFSIHKGDVFIIMGGSGCGKSTLLRHLLGLNKPAKGKILFQGEDLWQKGPSARDLIMRRVGVLYQRGGLWSSMTLAENIALPLREYTRYTRREISELCELKLSLVGLAGFGNYYPAQISGGMQKRAGLARAIALDPELLFFDEPSAGLDPVTAKRMDDLILQLQASLGATLVVVTHELASIFAIGSNAVFLDSQRRTITAAGPPKTLLATCTDQVVLQFLTRDGSAQLPA
jgi:phospholipid/cholesterol/gamma-HCH transport system ATP-binding protein